MTTVTLTPADNGNSPWTVPADVWEITVGATGAGGKGADVTSSPNSGGGGGGGAWSGGTLQVIPGQQVYFNVPADNSVNAWLNISANSAPASASDGVLAESGESGTMAASGAGGAAANGVGHTRYSGGAGAFYSPSEISGTLYAWRGWGGKSATGSGDGADEINATGNDIGADGGSRASEGGEGAAWASGEDGPYYGYPGAPGQIEITYTTRAAVVVADHNVTLTPGSNWLVHNVADTSKKADDDCLYDNNTVVTDQFIVTNKTRRDNYTVSVDSYGKVSVSPNEESALDYYFFEDAEEEWSEKTKFVYIVDAVIDDMDLDDIIDENQTNVEIHGSGFGSRKGLVKIGNNWQEDIASWTDTKIVLNTLNVMGLTGNQTLAIYKPKQ